MERRRHPNYVRRTAALTYGIVFGGLACLLLGIAVRGTAWRNLETIFNLAFCGAVLTAVFHWFGRGESTACPQCGRRLKADAPHNPGDPASFVCSVCEIEWLSQTEGESEKPD